MPQDLQPSRRAVFRLVGLAGVAAVATASGAEVAFGAPPDGDVLVVLTLRGGFDGLSAVAPVGDPFYRRLRPTLAVPPDAARRVDDTFGLHPSLAPLFPRWNEGTLAAVHAVGGQTPTRSHLAATAALERAAPESAGTGWIQRALAAADETALFDAVQVGVPALPGSLAGPQDVYAVNALRNVKLVVKERDVPATAWQDAFAELARDDGRDVIGPATDGVRGVVALGDVGRQTSSAVEAGYPRGNLGEALHDVARLVRSEAGVRVATIDFGGWDLHAAAGRGERGRMADRLEELAGALAAFADDLGDDYGRVTLVTLSEFGRRARENGSGGTDHGYGNAVFVLGGAVRGGKVYGRWPGLDILADDDLPGTTDYRTVLAEILTTRLKLTDTAQVFPGFTPEPLGLLRRR